MGTHDGQDDANNGSGGHVTAATRADMLSSGEGSASVPMAAAEANVPQHLQSETAAIATATASSDATGNGAAAPTLGEHSSRPPWSNPNPEAAATAATTHDDYTRMEDGQPVTATTTAPPQPPMHNPPPPLGSASFDSDNLDHYLSSPTSETLLSDDVISDPRGFGVIALLSFLTDMSRGVFFPVMWNLVQSLGGSEVTLGYTISSFAFGKIIVTPLFGGWSATYGYRPTLLFSASVLLAGAILFVFVPCVGSPAFLILANTTLGIGSGSNGVTRAFVADVTPQRNRTTYMGWLKGTSYAGFATTPFLGSFLSWYFSKDGRSIERGAFVLNQFTAPAYFMMPLILLQIYLLATHLDEPVRHSYSNKGPPPQQQNGGRNSGSSSEQLSGDGNDVPVVHFQPRLSNKRRAREYIGKQASFFGPHLNMNQACLLGIMCLNIAITAAVGCFETVGMQFAEQFDLNGSQAGAIVATCGTVGLLFLLSMSRITQCFTDVQIICGSISAMLAGMLLNATMSDDGVYAKGRYFFSIFSMYAVGFPIGHTAVIGLCSKVIGKQPQGRLLGWFSASGALSRLIFPILAEYIVVGLGMQSLFIFLSCFLTVVLGTAIMFRKTLAALSV